MNYNSKMNPCQANGNVLHVLADGDFICKEYRSEGYYMLEDIIEHGVEYIMHASAMHCQGIAMCVECWNAENIGIHLLREV